MENIKSIIYNVVKRVLTWFGDIMMATKPPKTKAEQILKMMEIIEPGDIICRAYSYYLDSYFIPGVFSHSGIVIDDNKMIHSIAEGVQEIHPIDFIKDTDGFIILRPKYKDFNCWNKVIERAKWHVENKTQYDFLFSDPDKFYCHEFTADCLSKTEIVIPISVVTPSIVSLFCLSFLFTPASIIA